MNILVFDRIDPVLAAMLFGAPGWLVLRTVPGLMPQLRWGYVWLVAVYWFFTGLAALLDSAGSRSLIGAPDATFFYELSTARSPESALDELALRTEGPLAVVLWQAAYRLAEWFGIQQGPYIGIGVNIAFMAATGVAAMRMSILVFGRDPINLRRLMVAFASCGLFILFAVIHVREAMICFAVGLLGMFWVQYLARRTLLNLTVVALMSVAMTPILGYLRTEFLYVPVAMAGAAALALVFASASEARPSKLVLLRVMGVLLFVGLLSLVGAELTETLEQQRAAYSHYSAITHGADSLGVALVTSQPALVRLLVAPPYLLLSPIPAWAGITSGNAYHICKSLWALFGYWLVPTVAAAGWVTMRSSVSRTPARLFLGMTFAAFVMAVSMSSLEARHIGPFVLFALVFSLVFDSRNEIHRSTRRQLLAATLFMMVGVHALWLAVKFL